MASWIKLVLISTGFVAVAMHLKVFLPLAIDFSRSPFLLSSFLSWLKPPYLYIITNVIIIVIGVSSRCYWSISSHDGKHDEVSYSGDNKFQTEHHHISYRNYPSRRACEDVDFGFVAAISPSIIFKKSEVLTEVVYEEEEKLAEAVARVDLEKTRLLVVVETENLSLPEKPLVSSRIGNRKPVKTTTAERNSLRALKVMKPRRNETLENTWKIITEGKPTPLTNHYRRSDTFGLGDGDSNVLKKAETLKDRSKFYLSPAVSRSRDELNGKVEAFIKKCNEERFASMREDKEVTRRGLQMNKTK